MSDGRHVPSSTDAPWRRDRPISHVRQTLARSGRLASQAIFALLLALASPSAAGPFAPAAGQPGSTAVDMSSNAIMAWATGWVDYQTGANCVAAWQMPEKALGPATGDVLDIVCLGDAGRITMTFDTFITNGPGADFAIFENGFSDTFLELAFVEVSSDGTNFIRLPNQSLTASPVPFVGGSVDPTNVQGLGCKYRKGYGEPFDLDGTGIDWITHVRLVDIVGDGSATDSVGHAVYDPYPTTGSAGFDLDAVAVLNGSVWRWMPLPDFADPAFGEYNSPALAHLPDGRFLFGNIGRLWRQNAWGGTSLTELATGATVFDPSFLAIRDASNAIIGQGGLSGVATDIFAFDPSSPSAPTFTSIAEAQSFSGCHWSNPATGREGWLIAGNRGSLYGASTNSVTYVTLDGATNRVVIDNLSSFSGGIAADANGNVFAAAYGSLDPVYRFSAAQIEAALSGSPLDPANGAKVHEFVTAASLAIDSLGRLWAGGFKTNALEVYDPATGASGFLAPDHPALTNALQVMYQAGTFLKDGEGWITAVARDAYDNDQTGYYCYAKAAAFVLPNTYASWCAFHFSEAERTPALESSVWGFFADPDHDGMANGIEYAFCRDPRRQDPGHATEAGISDGRLTVAFTRDPLNWDLDYVVEVSASLQPGDWQEIARSAAGDPAGPSGIGPYAISETSEGVKVRVTVTDPVIGPRRFIRVRVEWHEP